MSALSKFCSIILKLLSPKIFADIETKQMATMKTK
jgi:hypothetical protein